MNKQKYSSVLGFLIGFILGAITIVVVSATVYVFSLLNADSESDSKEVDAKMENVVDDVNEYLKGIIKPKTL